MSRVLRRPMFRRGGTVNDGIMTGLTDRKQYAEGPTQAEIYQKQYELNKHWRAINSCRDHIKR